jgi:hypothetical protein
MRSAGQKRATPFKMAGPSILPRVEQSHSPPCLRVQAGDIRPLVAIAKEAGEGEVLRLGRALVLAGNDVVKRVR